MRKSEKEITGRSEIEEIIRKSIVCRIALSENDMLIRLSLVGALRPDGHERTVRSVEDQEMLVARVTDSAVGDLGHEDHVVRLGGVQFALDSFLQILRRRDDQRPSPLLNLYCMATDHRTTCGHQDDKGSDTQHEPLLSCRVPVGKHGRIKHNVFSAPDQI